MVFIACASNKSSDKSAHLGSLARAIQNISAFRRHRHAIDGGFYCMCEQLKSSDESAHLSSLARTFATPIQNIRAFRSHRQFRHAIKRLQETSDEYAPLSSLAKAFATPIQNISAFRRQRHTRDVGFHGRFIACASNESSESAHYSSLVRASTTSVHLGDVDTQLFIAFSNHESTGFHWNKQADPTPPGKSWIYPE